MILEYFRWLTPQPSACNTSSHSSQADLNMEKISGLLYDYWKKYGMIVENNWDLYGMLVRNYGMKLWKLWYSPYGMVFWSKHLQRVMFMGILKITTKSWEKHSPRQWNCSPKCLQVALLGIENHSFTSTIIPCFSSKTLEFPAMSNYRRA